MNVHTAKSAEFLRHKVLGELKVLETEELHQSVAHDLLYNTSDECLEELFKKGKKVYDGTHRRRNTGDDNEGGGETGS